MAKSLQGIAAQGAQMFREISKMSFVEEYLKYEESKLDPLTAIADSAGTYEGGLSSSPLLPPPATHTKKT